MSTASKEGRRTLARPAALSAALVMAAACGGTSASGPPPGPPPLISVEVIGLTPRASAAGLVSGAAVQILDGTTFHPVSSATVSVNGTSLVYWAPSLLFEHTLPISAGDTVTISVTVNGQVYASSVTPFTLYPAVSVPGPGATWPELATNEVSWTQGAPGAMREQFVGVLEVPGVTGFLPFGAPGWMQVVPAGDSGHQVPAGAVAPGARLVAVGAMRELAFPSASTTIRAYGFDAVPVTVE